MNWKGCGRKRSWSNLKYNTGIRLEGLWKAMKFLSKDNLCSGHLPNTSQLLSHFIQSRRYPLLKRISYLQFEVLTAVVIKTAFFWDITLSIDEEHVICIFRVQE
jgi:hypothetical protein